MNPLIAFVQAIASIHGVYAASKVPADLFSNPQRVVATMQKNQPGPSSGNSAMTGQVPSIVSYDPDAEKRVVPIDPAFEADRKALVRAALKGDRTIIPGLMRRLESVFSADTLATDVGVALLLEHRGPEALVWLSPHAAAKAEDDSWMLWYSLALADAGREMQGQRAFLLKRRQTLRPDDDIWTMLPKDSEPGSLAVQTIYSICMGSERMYQSPRETIHLALKYRPNDPWACMEMGVRSFEAGNYAESKRWLTRGVGYSPDMQGTVDQLMAGIRRRGF